MSATSRGELPALDITFEEDPRVLKQAATEDYSLHVVPRSWRSSRWSLMMAWYSLCSGMFYLVVAGTVALAVGTVNALIGIVLSVIAYGIINWVIQSYAAKTGLTVSLFSRSMFGYLGSVVAPLIFGVTAIYYTVFEGSVIAATFQYYIGGPLKLWYLIVILYSMPLVIGGVRVWLDKLNGILLPFYLLGLFGALIWTIVEYGYSDTWIQYKPESMAGITGPGWWFAFTAYMGVWILMMYTWDFGRFGKEKDNKFHGAVTFGPTFYVLTYLINGIIGIFLAHTIKTEGGLSEVTVVFALVELMGVLGVIFVWVSQTRINTANLYLASTNMESFFSRLFKIKLNRLWWVLFCGIAAYLLMLTNIFSYILRALSWQAVFIVAWVGIALTFIAHRHLRGHVDAHKLPEFRPGRVRYFAPGLVSWIVASGVGIALTESGASWAVTWAPVITFALGVVIMWVTMEVAAKRLWVMARPNDPRDEVADPWEARIKCHVCERSYIAIEMDRDPSHEQKPICAGCASESMSFYKAASEEADNGVAEPVEGVQQA
jgi:purine-cytosine permease-like protein